MMASGSSSPPRADDVPVFVDAVIDVPEFPFVRCNYLSIEHDLPDPSWALGLEGRQLPLLLLGRNKNVCSTFVSFVVFVSS